MKNLSLFETRPASGGRTSGMASSLQPGLHRYSQMERVHWGRPVSDVLKQELEIVGAQRVFLVTNRSLAATAAVSGVVETLGGRFVGRFDNVTAHTPRACVIAGAAAARAADADLLLAVGGGSVIDGAKAMLLCLRHGYTTTQQLEPHANVRTPDLGHAPSDAMLWLRLIAVPTTLSAAEFTPSAGLTDASGGLKHAFTHPMQVPQAVILDPAMTLATPVALLKATGMKAVDHAAERMTSAAANAYSDSVSEMALQMLGEGLSRIDDLPKDLNLRSKLQYGMFMSMIGSASGVAVNVSHALGHVLGAHASVPHGQTTGLVLPAVLRWNRDVTADAQARISASLGGPEGDGAAAVANLAKRLSMPTRLRDVGVAEADIPILALKTMHETLLANSRKPVTGPAEVEFILRSAW